VFLRGIFCSNTLTALPYFAISCRFTISSRDKILGTIFFLFIKISSLRIACPKYTQFLGFYALGLPPARGARRGSIPASSPHLSQISAETGAKMHLFFVGDICYYSAMDVANSFDLLLC
jgi:hypothetical protein